MNEFDSLGMPYTDVEKLIKTAAAKTSFTGTLKYLASRGISFDDVIQECLLHTWRYQTQYDASTAKPSTFVFMCVKSAVLNMYAKQSRNGRERHGEDISITAIMDDDAHPEYGNFLRSASVSDGTSTHDTLMDVTNILTPHYGKAMVGVFFDVAGKVMSEREAADLLGINRGALSERIRRMRRKLLQEYGDTNGMEAVA